MKLGLNNDSMQRANRNLIISLLLELKSVSRIELAKRTNLQRATITNIINEFLEMGVVREDGFQLEENGRKTGSLYLNIKCAVILTARLTREFFDVHAFSLSGENLATGRIDIVKDAEIHETMKTVYQAMDALVARFGEKNVLGLCMGLPGPYIRNQQNVAIVTGFQQLGRIDMQQDLEKRYSFPVVTEHDAKLSAFAEWKTLDPGTQANADCLIAIQSIGIGIGSGMIVHGRIFSGAVGVAGEIGHMGINFNGDHSRGGNRGTFESYASTGAAKQYLLERLYDFPDTSLSEHSNYEDIKRAYAQNDSLALVTMDKLAWMLGYGLTNLVFVLNPNRIVLSEDYPKCPRFLDKVREGMRQMLYPELLSSIELQYSHIDMDSTILGGYYLVIESLLKQNILLERLKQIEA